MRKLFNYVTNLFDVRVLTVAALCMTTVVVNAQKSVTVNVHPKPTVELRDTAVCQGEKIKLTFVGWQPFTLAYTISASGIPLPNVFRVGAAANEAELTPGASVNINGLSVPTYTVEIEAGTAGIFTFNLTSITDSRSCVNNTPMLRTITVYPRPMVRVANATLCLDDSLKFTLIGMADFDLTYTMSPTGMFNFGLPTKITNNHCTDSVDYTAPDGGIVGKVHTAAIPAGEAGVFMFNLTKIKDAHGCQNDTAKSITVTVNPKPFIIASSTMTLCQGGKVEFDIVGSSDFKMVYNINPAGAHNYALPDTLKAAHFTGSPTAYIVNGATMGQQHKVSIEAGEAGLFVFTLDSIKDANSCVNDTNKSITITVNPKPIVLMPDKDTICEGGKMKIIFIGMGTDFDLNYTIDSGSITNIPAATLGLPTNFATTHTTGDSILTLKTPIMINNLSVPVYEAEVTGGAGGTFTFNLTKVKDNIALCENDSAKKSEIFVRALPDANITITDICEDGQVQVDFTGTPNFTLTYTIDYDGLTGVQPNTLGLTGQFTLGANLSHVSGNTYKSDVTAGRPGTFTFNLTKIEDKYCTRNY